MGANIKNNHVSALGVGSANINPGATAFVPDWNKAKLSYAVKTWLELKLIEVVSEDVEEGGKPAGDGKSSSVAPSMPGVDPEAAEKQKIIDKLESKYGITKTQRTSLANLQKALEEAGG